MATSLRHLCLGATMALLVMLCASASRAGHIDHTVTFSPQDLIVSERGDYDVFEIPGCDLTRNVGEPQLPVIPVTLALPEGARPTMLEVLGAESVEFAGPFHPMPAQEPAILPIPGFEPRPWRFSEPSASVYRGESAYPSPVATITSSGRLGGNAAVGLSVHPLQYLPGTKKIRFFKKIDLRLHYEGGSEDQGRERRREPVKQVAKTVYANADALSEPLAGLDRAGSRLDPGDYEYVIITDQGYVSAFEPLRDWKTRKGVPAATVTVDWIDSSYAGPDAQTRIREFIADAYQTWGTTWFLLGGDTQVIPARRAYAMTSEAGFDPIEDEIGCDLYYSDLDGTWDGDEDGTYGETEDAVDLYPDVFVGRAPVRTNLQVDAFVSKVLAYEKEPPSDFGLEMLMAAEVLWNDPFTDSGIALNMIDREYVPPRYDPITKLYETLGNESVAAVVDALNAGQNHFLHSGHAWVNVMGCGDGYLSRGDVDALQNGVRAPVVYSIGCWPAAFDLDGNSCIAEHFLWNENGGAVGFIGNSRYGWGSPGNPGYGYSERFMQAFYELVFGGGPRSVGAALAAVKAELVPFSRAENVYRWHQYELNLLGDPEMPIWTDEPEALQVTHVDSVNAGATTLDVAVWTSSGPVEDALVCLRGTDGVYERDRTGGDGSVTLEFEAVTPESLELTVTAADCMPYTASVDVNIAGAYLRVSQVQIDDSEGGNGDGLAGPGETIDATVTLRNYGSDPASAVEASVSCDDPLVQVLSDVASYGDVPGGTDAQPTTPFTILVDASCPDGHTALLDLVVWDSGVRTSWPGAVALTVSAPVIGAGSYSIDDSAGGDADGSPEPGESVTLMLDIANLGSAAARSPVAQLSSLDPDISVAGGGIGLHDIAPGASRRCVFEIDVAPACPQPHFPTLSLDVTTADGHALYDTFKIAVGHTGMSDDFESGAGGWTHSGPNDLWSLTSNRSHSGSTSWYSGASGAWEYENNMDAGLVSPEFVTGVETELSFWCWYEFPTYHEDGLYVELMADGVPVDTLDFIGSGGALQHLGYIGNDWLKYRYGIEWAPGETLSVRFRLRTDESEVAEGAYIDDVTVTTGAVPAETAVDDAPEAVVPAVVHQNRPNPFTASTMIGFSMYTEAHVILSIYNIQGRLIRTVVDDYRGPGEHSAPWDGRDQLGADVAAGVYLYRLTIGEYEDTGKMILVR